MRVYLFNPDNGVFEGETFDESGIINHEDGVTDITPPDYGNGEVPVFDRRRGEWSVLPVSVVRQQLLSSPTTEEKES